MISQIPSIKAFSFENYSHSPGFVERDPWNDAFPPAPPKCYVLKMPKNIEFIHLGVMHEAITVDMSKCENIVVLQVDERS